VEDFRSSVAEGEKEIGKRKLVVLEENRMYKLTSFRDFDI
jgi:hypothetical protein